MKIKPQEVYVTAIIYFEQEFETGTWFIAFIQQQYDKIHQLSINSYIRVIIGFDYFGQTEILIKSIHILHYFFRVLLQQRVLCYLNLFCIPSILFWHSLELNKTETKAVI